MSGVINRLPKLLANQIAAGEVVGSPASVVKELVENSVDAEATYVIVSIKEGGKSLIQVIDDGKGMSPDDAMLAFERHATSKIATLEDLSAINTFGFRGEALASIASVAEVELDTRRESDDIGYRVAINGGTVVSSEPSAYASCGTQFVVRNLFYNIPARKKSLKKDFSETKRVIQEFERVSLCHPRVAFSLYTDDKLLHMLTSTINIRHRITALFGKNMGNSLVELYVNTSMVEVKGYIGKPEIAKKRANTFLFVNNRYFESPYLYKAVQSAYDKLIPDGSMPPFFLYIKVDPQNIDVNVSPTKTTVRFDEEQAIWQIVNAAVRESLGKNGIVPMIDFSMSADSVDLGSAFSNGAEHKRADRALAATEYNPFNDTFSFTKAVSGRSESFRDSFTKSDYSPFDSTDVSVDSFNNSKGEDADFEFESVEFGVSEPKKEENFDDNASFRDAIINTDVDFEVGSGVNFEVDRYEEAIDVEMESLIEYEEYSEPKQERLFDEDFTINNIFIFASRYAVTEIAGGVYIFDINRANSSVNYQIFLRRIENRGDMGVEKQKLLFPIDVSFSADDRHTLDSFKEQLAQLGFIYESLDGGSSVCFTEVPADIEPADTDWFIEDVLTTLKFSDAQIYKRSINEQIALSLSRTISRRRKGDYSVEGVKYMIEELIKSGNYSYTVDGKAVIISISVDQLSEMLNK